MDKIVITPSPLSGELTVPPSKSATHRSIICAALSNGESILSGVAHSEDIDATLRCVSALGATVAERDDCLYIKGIDRAAALNKRVTLDCGESGSTLRFMLPIAAALGVNATFIGHGRLPSRPITPLTEILSANGVTCSGDHLPLEISGRLKAGEYQISGNVSSQYLTGLLFAITINSGSARLTTPLESASYVNMTVKVLKTFGVDISKQDGLYLASGSLSPTSLRIEGDWSQACFFLSAAALGGSVKINGLDFNSTQGDKTALELYKAFGAKISLAGESLLASSGELSAIEINCSQIPDAVPALATVAALSRGQTKIFGGQRLRIKETDRIKTVIKGLRAMGITVTETQDGMLITGGRPKGGIVDGTGDHRIVMAFAVLATVADGPTVIEGYTAVNKSYPTFFEDFKGLGGKADVITAGNEN